MRTWWWKMVQLNRKLWVRTTAIGLLGVIAALVAAVAEAWIPWEWPAFVEVQAIESLLTIIASSMLAVTTFSLGIMTSAYGSASSGVTPRATKLLMEDTLTQTVLASFIGSFIFSIVGMIVLRFGAYGERGRVILFVVTIAVIALIVINLLRWIDYLTTFGRLGETTCRVEAAAQSALEERLAQPYLGGHPWQREPLPAHARSVMAQQVGFVQHIDLLELQTLAEQCGARIYVAATPGVRVFVDTPLAWVVAEATDASQPGATPPQDISSCMDALRCTFTVAGTRDFSQDPRFGLAVMSEIASRALSPATNDPGTALDVISRNARLLTVWAQGQARAQAEGADTPTYPRLWVPPVTHADLLDDAFTLMARDGAGLIEIQLSLQKALAALARIGPPAFQQAVRVQAQSALARANSGLTHVEDQQRLQALVQGLQAGTVRP